MIVISSGVYGFDLSGVRIGVVPMRSAQRRPALGVRAMLPQAGRRLPLLLPLEHAALRRSRHVRQARHALQRLQRVSVLKRGKGYRVYKIYGFSRLNWLSDKILDILNHGNVLKSPDEHAPGLDALQWMQPTCAAMNSHCRASRLANLPIKIGKCKKTLEMERISGNYPAGYWIFKNYNNFLIV